MIRRPVGRRRRGVPNPPCARRPGWPPSHRSAPAPRCRGAPHHTREGVNGPASTSIDTRLQPVLDVAAENAAPSTATAGSPRRRSTRSATGPARSHAPRGDRRARAGPRTSCRCRALASRCASPAMIYLMHVCAAQVTLAGPTPGIPRRCAAWPTGRTCPRSRSANAVPQPLLGTGQPDRRGDDHRPEVVRHRAGHAETYVVSTRPEGTDSPIESSLYLVGAGRRDRDRSGLGSGSGCEGTRARPMTFDIAGDASCSARRARVST